MGSISIWHWLIVLVIVMMIFGTKKLRHIGEDLGGAVRGFKEGIGARNVGILEDEVQSIKEFANEENSVLQDRLL